MPCSYATRTRNQLKFAGGSQTVNRSQPLVGRSSPYCKDMWRRYCCLTSFFPIVDTCLNCGDIARQFVRWCPDGDFWRLFCVLYFQRAACSTFPVPEMTYNVFSGTLNPTHFTSLQHVSDLHPKFALRPHHVWKYGRHPICDG